MGFWKEQSGLELHYMVLINKKFLGAQLWSLNAFDLVTAYEMTNLDQPKNNSFFSLVDGKKNSVSALNLLILNDFYVALRNENKQNITNQTKIIHFKKENYRITNNII